MAWCVTIITRSYIDIRRKVALVTVPIELVAGSPSLGYSQDYALDERTVEILGRLHSVGVITKIQAMILSLQIIEQLSLEEIADILKKTRAAISALSSRAKVKIGEYLRNESNFDSL